MANPEHLEMLKQGVEGWNAWRASEPLVIPDLRGAHLLEADFDARSSWHLVAH
jgi:hypothetical protein